MKIESKKYSGEEIQKLFNSIAENYDFLNNIISLFTHKIIKKRAIKLLSSLNNKKGLDLCCGSGDLGAIAKKLYPKTDITGVDFSEKMLKIASKRHKNIKYYKKDATELDFKDGEFDYILIGFGLRNIPDKEKALNSTNRVLKKGGLFLHLDFNSKSPLNKIYNTFVAFITSLILKNNSPYIYLINSKNNFLNPDELLKMFNRHGFVEIKRKNYIFGIITAQIFQKS